MIKKIFTLFFVMILTFTAIAEWVPSPSIEPIEDPVMELADFIGIECVESGTVEVTKAIKIHKYFITYEAEVPQIVCVQPNESIGKAYIIAQENISSMLTVITLAHMYYNVPAIIIWDEVGIYNWEIQEIMYFLSEINE